MIGVFDSGVGGLTVLKALRSAMPRQDFFYLGDTARVPYGRKPPDMVRAFAQEITAFLVAHGAEAIVVACNTASAVALTDLRRGFSLPIWGVIEPGVEAAIRVTSNRRVGVIGTRGAIASGAYQRLLEEQGIQVWARACPLFVHLVEEGLSDSPEAEVLVRHYLSDRPQIDTLILGCTHYPVLAPIIGRVLGPDVKLVESAGVAAEYVRATVGVAPRTGMEGSGRITHFVTGDPIAYEHTAGVIGGVEGEIIALSVGDLNAVAISAPV